MGIRNTAKAIILNDNKMLVNKNQNSIGDICYGLPNGMIYYDLPGGGQNQYETLEEAVIRECIEETGYTVAVDRLAAVYEEISINNDFRNKYEEYAHKVHFVFICHLTDAPVKPLGEKDLDMIEFQWVNLSDIENIPLYPTVIKTNLKLLFERNTFLYLGSKRV